jgi:hypothetical protein
MPSASGHPWLKTGTAGEAAEVRGCRACACILGMAWCNSLVSVSNLMSMPLLATRQIFHQPVSSRTGQCWQLQVLVVNP